MNYIEKALLFLQILNRSLPVKKKELCQRLNLSEKGVQRLKNSLEEAGYLIEVIPGPYGGYRLMDSLRLTVPTLTGPEIQSLDQVANFLLSTQNPLVDSDFTRAIEKIRSLRKNKEGLELFSFFQRPRAMEKDNQDQVLDLLKEAIQHQRRVQIDYQKLDRTQVTYIFEPYQLFLQDEAWYVIGYLKHSHLASLKLFRFNDIHILKEDFLRDPNFSIESTLNQFGFKIDGKVHLKAIVYNRFYLQEFILADDQKVKERDDRSFYLSLRFNNRYQAIDFVNRLGADIDVLEPDWLAQEQRETAQQILNKDRENVHSLDFKKENF